MHIKQKLVSIKQSMCNFLEETYTEQSIKELITLAQGRSVNHYTYFCRTFLPAMVELDALESVKSSDVEIYLGKKVVAVPWVDGSSTCDVCALNANTCKEVPCTAFSRCYAGLSAEDVYFVEVT